MGLAEEEEEEELVVVVLHITNRKEDLLRMHRCWREQLGRGVLEQGVNRRI
jgi:hypothetical protein